MKHMLYILAIFLLAALSLAGCNIINPESEPESTPIPTVEDSGSIISQGNLVPRDHMYLAFPGAGHVTEILVEQGDRVTAGQVLAHMGDREQYEANLASAQLEVENAQQSLDELNANADISSVNAWLVLLEADQNLITAEKAWAEVDTDEYQEQVDDAEVKVSDAQTDLDDAREELDKYDNLDSDNPQRKSAETDLEEAQRAYDNAVHERDQLLIDRDRAEANLQMAQAQQAQAQDDYESTRQGPDPDQLKLAQMNLDTALSHQTAAQSALDNLELKSPMDGTVVDLNISEGELVGTGKWAVLVVDYSEWYVETNDLTEQEVVGISIGQGAAISPDALPDLKLTGMVTEIADMFTVQSGDILYKVRLLVEDPDPQLRWGMTVEVTFNP